MRRSKQLVHGRATVRPRREAESFIPPLRPLTSAGLWPAARPHTASSGLSDTSAGCLGPVWSSWQPAGGEWPGGTQLSVSVFPDHYDVWPETTMNQHPGSWLFIKHFSYINLIHETKRYVRYQLSEVARKHLTVSADWIILVIILYDCT